MESDAELLQRYVERRDEPAFTELVQRHLPLVYAAAYRRTNGRTALAKDIAQTVFCGLARKAAVLRHHPTLAGWLYRSTRYAAVDAIRGEVRRQKLAQSFLAMSTDSGPGEPIPSWEQLRPLLDQAMDQLKERDRAIMLLRFFSGLTYAEVGAKLGLTENGARMRTERALERLRMILGQRGVVSTVMALGAFMTNEALASAPAGLAAAISSAGLATAGQSGIASLASLILMNKAVLPLTSAVLAALATGVAVNAVVHPVSVQELAALRSDHARLVAALAPGADPAALTAAAGEFSNQATAVAHAFEARTVRASSDSRSNETGGLASSAPKTAASGRRNRGQASAVDTAQTMAWAAETANIDALAKVFLFEGDARVKAQAVWDSMPTTIQSEYPTIEKLYAFIMAADAITYPPPGPDVIDQYQNVPIRDGRVARVAPGYSVEYANQFQSTSDGWKWAINPGLVVTWPQKVLTGATLAKLSSPSP